jgi:cell division protease FtsH
MRSVFRNFLYFFLAFILVAGVLSTFSSSGTARRTLGIDEFVALINEGKVKDVLVSGDRLDVTLADGSRAISRKEPADSLSQLLKNYDVAPDKLKAVKVAVKDNTGAIFWLNTVLPFLIPFLLIAGFIWITFRQVQGQNSKALSFGQSAARETTPRDLKQKITFSDVAGVKEAKEELKEVVEFLRNPRKFTALGARIPKGVLLVGAPGTGKTLLAKAVAGEANVPFFNISGSEFVEMFVGVGASRVRDLFRKAKRHAPCIVFIDEIDAVGRQRGAGLGGSHDEREQTLNQILVEMDGFDTDTNVIVVAATNRPDILDPALLRPGRFDRRVVLDEPDISDREAILKVHAVKKPLAQSVNMRKIAERTPGFTGADLANLLNEAAILAARANRKAIEMADCLESIEKVLLGPERKSHILSDREKKITAYHEAGHALVAHVLPAADPVHKVSIISRGRAAGYTLKLPTEDKHLHARSEFVADLAVMLAGWTTEKETFREVTTGASNDLKQATKLARQLVTVYGMSDALGPRTFGDKEELIFLGREITEQRDYSEKVAESIDSEVSRFISAAQRTAKAIITKFKPQLERIVKALMEKETLERDAFEALLTDVPKGARFAVQTVRA